MADYVYPNFKKDVLTGVIDLDTDTFYIMLVTSTYTPSASDHYRSDVTNEVTGTGYTAGGQALTSVTAAISGTTLVWDAADPSWTSSTITARGAVVYKHRGGASSADELCCYFDFGADKSSSSGTFTIQINAAGLLVAS